MGFGEPLGGVLGVLQEGLLGASYLHPPGFYNRTFPYHVLPPWEVVLGPLRRFSGPLVGSWVTSRVVLGVLRESFGASWEAPTSIR